ncbi:hypothetical protein SERLADRAFT_454238 [Serpula lacrymans var. lacrymans S7.9]|uniref:Uncharacterized protein n=1 Tax=Serpula lacrymans var. lacrymans (strain S7.9) TaxID=578457 RepID=F8PE54_SERL9|nr:uncharacterized protein SERLADRAFT_454238 [Serpula lacrymans var. lacrymans S7.9]EGO18651.1 hypothetical protein SERLADRAFT_454238 [Serpula lacrymans var. lacrymans S7.9]
MLQAFWDRINTGGRDFNDGKLFKMGEEFVPIGPPRQRKRKRSQNRQSGALNQESPASRALLCEPEELEPAEKQGQSSSALVEEPQAKRRRGGAFKERPLSKGATKENYKHTIAGGSLSSPIPSSLKKSRQPPPSCTSANMDERNIVISSDMDDDELLIPSPELTRGRFSGTRDSGEVGAGNGFADLQHPGNDEASIRIQPSKLSQSPKGVTSPNSLFSGSPPFVDRAVQDIASLPRPSTTPRVPSHRARAAQPLVRFVDDPLSVPRGEGAISVKARLLGRSAQGGTQNGSSSGMASSMASQSPNSSSRHDRPVKGRPKNRSSLLTAHKGELTTVKGTFKPPPAADLSLENSDPAGNAAIDIDQELFGVESETEEIGDKREEKAKVKASEPAPSGDELLHIAGINEDATNLSDFEEDAPAGNPKSSAAADAEAPQSSVEVNKQTSPSALPSSRDISAAWKSSTIFGPLYLGVSNSHASPPGTHNDSASRPAFSVTFNTSMSIPVSFKDIYTKNGSAALDTIIDNVRTGPPGTFYGQNCALSLIHTLQGERTGARVTAEASEGNEGEKQFLHFYNRLHSGEVVRRVYISCISMSY